MFLMTGNGCRQNTQSICIIFQHSVYCLFSEANGLALLDFSQAELPAFCPRGAVNTRPTDILTEKQTVVTRLKPFIKASTSLIKNKTLAEIH